MRTVYWLQKQAEVLRISRGGVYYLSRPVPDAGLVMPNNGIAISMDGKGAWRDNVFVEGLWRGVKYEEAYLRACDSVSEARASIGRYLDFLQWPATAFEP